MLILGIETSCDETSAAVLKKQKDGRVIVLSNIIASSASLQSKYGGIIPEQAAREQLKSILPVIEEALFQANITSQDLDAIAVTQGPGLIGSLLVGVETAKILSLIWHKPLIPINHLIGHFYANWIHSSDDSKQPTFPCLGLLVSGGHTDIVLFKDHLQFEYLGGTRDDAAGECFDKCARLLNLPYPGGPQISLQAQTGNPQKYQLPEPMIDSPDLDLSFSGLKTAVSNLIPKLDLTPQTISDLSASIEKTIISCLVKKTLKAAQLHNIEQIIVAGGVAANSQLIANLKQNFSGEVLSPPPILCTDNAAMIASAAIFNYSPIKTQTLQANPNLSLAS